MKMKQKKGLEFKILNQKLKENTEKINEGINEGNKLGNDKQLIEAQIEKVMASGLSPADKKAILVELKAGIAKVNTEYKNVEKKVSEAQNDNKDIIDEMDDNANILESQKTELSAVKLESGAVDMKKAIEETEKKKQEFSTTAQEAKAKLQASIDTMNAQKRMMMRNKFSGK